MCVAKGSALSEDVTNKLTGRDLTMEALLAVWLTGTEL